MPNARRCGVACAALALSVFVAGCSSGDDSVFGAHCDVGGTWATFVEVGVSWESGTIAPGAGLVRQWVLHKEVPGPGGPEYWAVSCGIGAKGVPLGSPWFSTKRFDLGSYILPSEWVGVSFLPTLFDEDTLPKVQLSMRVDRGDPSRLQRGAHLSVDPAPFQHGTNDLGPDVPWPDAISMRAFVVDHDKDGFPGLTGVPLSGQVPGEPAGVTFTPPRVDALAAPVRTSALFMAIRNRAALDLTLRSCESPPDKPSAPPQARFEGKVLDGTLVIETRNVACLVSQTGAPCDDAQSGFIDSNLPVFEHNGTSRVISISVPDDTTCEDVRALLR